MSLPQEKKDKLAERVTDDLVREMSKHFKDLKNHDIGDSDAREIVGTGWSKAGKVSFDEMGKEPPKK